MAMVKLLAPGQDPDLQIVETFGCYAHLWSLITFSELLYCDLACLPFRVNGCIWRVALWVKRKR